MTSRTITTTITTTSSINNSSSSTTTNSICIRISKSNMKTMVFIAKIPLFLMTPPPTGVAIYFFDVRGNSHFSEFPPMLYISSFHIAVRRR